jgi:hypothetical protein
VSDDEGMFGKAGRVRPFTPTLGPRDQKRLLNMLKIEGGAEDNFADGLRRLARRYIDDAPTLELRTTLLLTADLVEQGWSLRLAGDHFIFEPPGLSRGDGSSIAEVKERVQRSLHAGRERQLREPSVRAFIARMEKVAPRAGGPPVSIADLIDDGSALAGELERVRQLPAERREAALKLVVDPVVEVCEAGVRCRDTGLPLLDIWRYFRHTWSHEYRSIPGRQMMVLIRNAARPKRPVMGIAMLASPVMRLTARDMWIGWLRPAAEERLASGAWQPAAFVRAMRARIDRSIADIRWDDLATPDEIASPTETVVFRLQQKAYGAAFERDTELRDRYGDQSPGGVRAFEKIKENFTDWVKASEDLLFVRKRAEGLAGLLFAKLVFDEFDLKRPTLDKVQAMLAAKRGQRAVDTALAEYRKAGLSSRVADVSVCGAVHPYNDLLGGKLVALMLTSREVRDAYARRYGGQVSVIASQMAGRPVIKPAKLDVLTTTSLYGLGSSQYNRLALRADDHWGIPFDIRWRAIGKSLTGGYGTLHLGAETVHALREMGERRHDARRINNRFGEGTSPRLRQVREGLDALGVESDRVLHHATPRLFYGCELDPGATATLLSMKAKAAPRTPSAAAIGAAWRRRWLLPRIDHAEFDVLERISGLGAASVQSMLDVPELPVEDQLELFVGVDD